MYIVDSDASLHMMRLLSFNQRQKKTIRRSSEFLDIQTAIGIVISDTRAQKSTSRSLTPRARLFWYVAVRRNSRLSQGKKVLERSIENFLSVVAVTEQKAASVGSSSAKGDFERENEVEDHVGSVKTPKAGSDPTHIIAEQLVEDKPPSAGTDTTKILRQKKPRVRKESSIPNQEEITMCSLITRKIPIVKFVRWQKQHERGLR